MAIKFRKDGPTYPTSVDDGIMRIYTNPFGGYVEVPVPQLKGHYEYDNSYFEVSNIMAYLPEKDGFFVIIRNDGSYTRYTSDYEIIGFGKVDIKTINESNFRLPVGMFITEYGHKGNTYRCCIRIFTNGDSILEVPVDPHPIYFVPSENPHFREDIKRGSSIFPLITNIDGVYYGDNGVEGHQNIYRISCTPIPNTGEVGL